MYVLVDDDSLLLRDNIFVFLIAVCYITFTIKIIVIIERTKINFVSCVG